jgi:hypothetical protein
VIIEEVEGLSAPLKIHVERWKSLQKMMFRPMTKRRDEKGCQRLSRREVWIRTLSFDVRLIGILKASHLTSSAAFDLAETPEADSF